jgi:hypothetical protein
MANHVAPRRTTYQALRGPIDPAIARPDRQPLTGGAPWWLVSVLTGVSVGSTIISGWLWALMVQR